MSALLALVAGTVSLYVIVYYGVFGGPRCSSAVKLKGKTAIVTGKGEELHLSAAAKMSDQFILLIHLHGNCVLEHFLNVVSCQRSSQIPRLQSGPPTKHYNVQSRPSSIDTAGFKVKSCTVR